MAHQKNAPVFNRSVSFRISVLSWGFLRNPEESEEPTSTYYHIITFFRKKCVDFVSITLDANMKRF